MDTERLALHQVTKDKKFMLGLNVTLAIIGLVSFIFGVATGIIPDWLNIVVGIMYIAIGVSGVVFRTRSDTWSAMWFYRILLIAIGLSALLSIIFLGVGLATPCSHEAGSQMCTDITNGYLTAGILTIVFSFVGLGFCAYFSKMLVDDLTTYTNYTKHIATNEHENDDTSLGVPEAAV